jgi:hypothetical protein
MDNRADGNLGAFMIRFYANSVGCLATFDNEVSEWLVRAKMRMLNIYRYYPYPDYNMHE